jgi:hypothetical protein
MKPTEPFSFGCRIVAEFDDDARAFAQAEAEFVPVKVPPTPGVPMTWGPTLQPPSSPFSEEVAAAAKKIWLKVIRRFTEPVPGKKGRLRVMHSERPNSGSIIVEYGRCLASTGRVGDREGMAQGHELEVTDKLFLTLYRTTRLPPTQHRGYDEDCITPIPWAEIANIRFEVIRPLTEGEQDSKAS